MLIAGARYKNPSEAAMQPPAFKFNCLGSKIELINDKRKRGLITQFYLLVSCAGLVNQTMGN
jgi:hypothetical protein